MAGKPSMMALLGLLAVAGYKNKDKISDMLSGAQNDASTAQNDPSHAQDGDQQSGSNSILSTLASMFGGSAAGGTLSHGLSELMEAFKQSGQNETADSWVGQGPNKNLDHGSLEQALGDDTLSELSQKTGLSRSELIERLTDSIPGAVDRYSPDGRLPTEQEAARYS